MFALWQDARFGLRTLARTPGFAVAALATLALGIGANAAIFSLVNALLRQELPVPDASGLVHVYQTRADRPADYFPLSLVDYRYYREQAESFEELAAHYPTAPLHLIARDATEAITGSVVTANYFRLLGLSPAAGRFFTDDEDRVPGRDPLVVISHAFWLRRFGADPRAVGSTISLNGTTFTVVGVAPREFVGVVLGGAALDVWIPSAMFRVGYRYCDAFQRSCTVVQMLGRLKKERTIAAAQRELDVLAGGLEAAYPAENKGLGVRALPARGSYPAQQAEADRPVKVLLVTVGVVLLIACANLAALLLARGMHRRKEIAIRLALGASRGRLIRQLLAESLVLALAGGALGLIVASWLKEYLLGFYATDYAGRALNFSLAIDRVVLLSTLVLSILTGVVFGLVPALQASGPDVVPVLKDETPAGGLRRSRLRDALIVTQVAASIALLIGAGLLVRSMSSIYQGPGFDPRPVVLLRLRPSLVEYRRAEGACVSTAGHRAAGSAAGRPGRKPGGGLPLFRHMGRGDAGLDAGTRARTNRRRVSCRRQQGRTVVLQDHRRQRSGRARVRRTGRQADAARHRRQRSSRAPFLAGSPRRGSDACRRWATA